MRIARSCRPRRALKRDSCKSGATPDSERDGNAGANARITAGTSSADSTHCRAGESMAKGKESRTVLRRSTLRVSC